MDKQLTDFKTKWADRENRHQAKLHAEDYVTDNLAELSTLFDDLTIEQFVQTVDLYRSQGREDMVAKAEMWNLAKIPPQRIIGSYGPPPRRNR